MKLASYNIPLLLAISLSLSNPCSPAKPQDTPPQLVEKIFEVRAIYPQFKDTARVVTGRGRFVAGERTTVKAGVSGLVEKINVNEGDQIKAGDPLCVAKSEELGHQIEMKQAQLREAEAQLDVVQKELEKIRQQNNQAEQPVVDGFIDESDASPTSDNSRVVDNYRVNAPVRNEVKPETETETELQAKLTLAESTVEKMVLELKQLEESLKQLTILAPIGGMVQKRLVSEGGFFQAGEALFEIVNLDPMTLSAHLPVDVASYVDKKSPVKAHPLGAADQLQEGVIFYVSPEIDTINKTIEVRLHLSNPSGAIKEGQEGLATVQTSRVDKVLILPSSAVTTVQGNPAIYVVQGNKAVLSPVEVGQKINDNEWEIRANLRVDDPVILNPPTELVDGNQVRVMENS